LNIVGYKFNLLYFRNDYKSPSIKGIMKKSGWLFLSIVLVFALMIFSLASLVSAGTLKVTEEHPFLVNGSWISASDLKVGDTLSTVDGKKVKITGLEDIVRDSSFPVYNLEAGFYHNFVVDAGDGLEVVVHNSNRVFLIRKMLRFPIRDLSTLTLKSENIDKAFKVLFRLKIRGKSSLVETGIVKSDYNYLSDLDFLRNRGVGYNEFGEPIWPNDEVHGAVLEFFFQKKDDIFPPSIASQIQSYKDINLRNYVDILSDLRFQINDGVFDLNKVEDLARSLSSVPDPILDNFISRGGRIYIEDYVQRSIQRELSVFDRTESFTSLENSIDFHPMIKGEPYAGYFMGLGNPVIVVKEASFLRTSVIPHEFGHFVTKTRLNADDLRKLVSIFKKRSNQIKICNLGEYCLKDPDELFTVSFEYYLGFNPETSHFVGFEQGRAILKSKFKPMYDFMAELDAAGFFNKMDFSPDNLRYIDEYFRQYPLNSDWKNSANQLRSKINKLTLLKSAGVGAGIGTSLVYPVLVGLNLNDYSSLSESAGAVNYHLLWLLGLEEYIQERKIDEGNWNNI
jgi:hypothetical protein